MMLATVCGINMIHPKIDGKGSQGYGLLSIPEKYDGIPVM